MKDGIYQVLDTQTRHVVRTFETLEQASRFADQMDQQYGAVCSSVRWVSRFDLAYLARCIR
jgi:hypothetical protein